MSRHDVLRRDPAALLSRHAEHCEGYFASASPSHLLGISLTTGVCRNMFPSPGSTKLDETNAFDLAEVARANLGQLNAITVSSFCGPHGLIWGYDACPPAAGHRRLGDVARGAQRAEAFDLDGLLGAFAALTGPVGDPRFPFMPGSHVPAAMKSRTASEPGVLYAGLGIGIPEDRARSACLLMEDVGFVPGADDPDAHRAAALECLAQAVLEVGTNQRVRYREVFVGTAATVVGPGETGCALAMAPYFLLARDAVPAGGSLHDLTLEAWEEASRPALLRAPMNAPPRRHP
ncbi:MAG: histidine decarboxylase, pyruvoyl type [Deltaproteobacteria bacterium]|nr:histidine decarboxylase, pyruvoyl type [Deltaproteobacteria bacterium]